MEIGDHLIEQRIKNFWGYGSLEASVWFVGMEEGVGPGDEEELEMRFRAGDGKQTADIRRDLGHMPVFMKWFRPGASPQTTWKYPLSLYLYLKNHRIPTREEVCEHQINILGDAHLKETCTVELMPLPSRSISEDSWLYGESGVAGLATRSEYLATYKPGRVQKLKRLAEEHKPKLVIFYSVGYLKEWTEVMGSEPEKVTDQMYFYKTPQTSFCVLPQANSRGMSYERLYEFGRLIAGKVEF